MNFDEFIDTAWNDHADRPQDIADRLAASLRIIETTDQIPPFARLATHVFGEHLGQWRRGIFVLDAVRDLPAFDNSAIVTGVLARSVAVLRYASGDHDALAPLAHEDRVSVLATASSAFAGRHEYKHALAAYTEALRLAQRACLQVRRRSAPSRWAAITSRRRLKRSVTATPLKRVA
jgi:hypothetical protein